MFTMKPKLYKTIPDRSIIILNARYSRTFLVVVNFCIEYNITIVPIRRYKSALVIYIYSPINYLKVLTTRIEKDFEAQLIF